ncbi:phage tail sheath family protein [Lactococcus lactis]|uniref:Phage tail sheath protein n=1 Tax=Lactococcus lactis TaxID=1358 RepID=A0A6B3S3J9_9LACT|nr:phage tail sheath family protein [Lactococcus lactis]MCT1174168.1 phage tail sheath protein [Lactococcus lactis]MCT1195257.1 phage tail sheath protein [Lactococcus lactis]NEX49346.1 phage tail sheath protein [Lactococcus lactis]NEX52797.1 phage tail sheath protein [Lactococcus lactis]NEX55400.1 phage tail sheath protein [Lactococcus lactis]
MAGGEFKNQDKKLAGAYVNVVSKRQPKANETESGVVFTITKGLKWGLNGVIEVNPTSNFVSLFGVSIDDSALTALRNILLQAEKVYVFNFNGGLKAAGTMLVLPWKFTAKYSGTRGNDLKVIVTPDPSSTGKYTVQTFFGTILVDTQSVSKASELMENDYFVATTVSGATSDDGLSMLKDLSTPVTTTFTGGTDVDAGTQTDALIEAIETYDFNVLTAAGEESTAAIHKLFAVTAIRLRDKLGRKVQAVIPESASYTPNHEGVIVVANGVKLKDGTVLTPTFAAAFVAGATSAAAPNQSLTYMQFPDAVDAVPRYNEETQIKKVNAGVMFFISSRGAVKISTDINSLHVFSNDKNKDFSKMRVLRVLDNIANDTRETWEDQFIGQVTNNVTGRDLFKADRVRFLNSLQSIGAIQNFDPAADIDVSEGENKDSVVATINVQPTDAMEKLYMTVVMN